MAVAQIINSIKLTKQDKQVLKAILNPIKEDNRYPEGNDILGIAKIVYQITV